MARYQLGRLGVVLFVHLLASYGCAHVISPEMRQMAREDLSFPVVLNNPSAYIGSTVVLGGVIVETVNRQDGTVMTILETPLDYRGMPTDEVYTRGRFMARVSGYLDEEVYRRGKKVTLAGEIIGKEVQPLGEIYYSYPTIHIKELHLIGEGPYPLFWPSFSFGFGYVHH